MESPLLSPGTSTSGTDKSQNDLTLCSEFKGFNYSEFDKYYNKKTKEPSGCKDTILDICHCGTAIKVKECIENCFPFVQFLKSYKFKSYICNDFLSGISVGFMALPQSLGYARIGNIPEVLGLYTSFFPVIIYFFFTTSKHVSLGTMVLTSMILASAVNTLPLPSAQAVYFGNLSANNPNFMGNISSSDLKVNQETLFEKDSELKILLTVSISCAAGVILVIMSFFRLGFIASFMSNAFISAYLASSFLRVVVIEFREMLGIHLKRRHTGVCEFFLNTFEVFQEIGQTNLLQVGMSIVSLLLLIFVRLFLNESFRKKFKFSFPIEMVVVIIAVMVTRFGRFETLYSVEVSEGMRAGLPSVVVPSIEMMYRYSLYSFMIALVSYMMVGMMAKLFAQNHGYKVDNNQEMFAIGVSGLLSSFFCSIFPSTSPPRCFLSEVSGLKTQASHLFTAAFALFTMVAFAPLLRDLPVCVLACIVLVACFPLLKEFSKGLNYWRSNKYDFTVWIVTFVSVLVFSVEMGMIIGVGFSLVVIHVWMQREAKISILRMNGDGVFIDDELYDFLNDKESDEKLSSIRELAESSIIVFKFDSSMYFNTMDVFKELLFSKVPTPGFLAKQKLSRIKEDDGLRFSFFSFLKKKEKIQVFTCDEANKLNEKLEISVPSEPSLVGVADQMTGAEQTIGDAASSELTAKPCLVPDDAKMTKIDNSNHMFKRIIIDCSNVSLLDASCAQMLGELNLQYRNVEVEFCLASCSRSVLDQLRRESNCQMLVDEYLYPSIHDAYLAFIKSETHSKYCNDVL